MTFEVLTREEAGAGVDAMRGVRVVSGVRCQGIKFVWSEPELLGQSR